MNHEEIKRNKKAWNLCYGFLILEENLSETVKKDSLHNKPDQALTVNKIYPGIWILDSQKLIQKIKDCMKRRPRE